MFDEFRKFIMRGNVIDLAIGIIIGTAFTAIVQSLVRDIIMPPIGQLVGGVDFSDIFIVLGEVEEGVVLQSVAQATELGIPTINIGLFINTIINFLLVALAVFFLIRAVNRVTERFEKEEEAAEEPAPAEPTTEEKLLDAINELTAAIKSQQS